MNNSIFDDPNWHEVQIHPHRTLSSGIRHITQNGYPVIECWFIHNGRRYSQTLKEFQIDWWYSYIDHVITTGEI